LLLLVLIAGGLGVYFLTRSRGRRQEWAANQAAARTEAAWLARELLPTLQTQSQDQVRGAWAVAQPRVSALEDRLVGLAATAPDDIGRGTSTTLLESVRAARGSVDRLVAPGAEDTPAARQDVLAAGRQIEQVLTAQAADSA
jgi:hypothetical protein